MSLSNRKNQSGVALITALLVVSLATVLAVSLVSHLYFDIRRTENILRLDQARIYNSNIVDFARTILLVDANTSELDSLEEAQLFNESAIMPYPDKSGIANATITDLQGCFNLNNLVENNQPNAVARTAYINILNNLVSAANTSASPDMPPLAPNVNVLADSLIDWIDADQQIQLTGNGAEFDHYLSKEPPYQTADAPLSSLSELFLIEGYNHEIVEEIFAEHICIIPSSTSPTNININTASAEVLESITGLSAAQVDTLIELRDGSADDFSDASPFEAIGDFQREVRTRFNLPRFETTGMQVYSEYFLIKTKVPLGEFEINMSTVIHRDNNTNETRIISQTRGDL